MPALVQMSRLEALMRFFFIERNLRYVHYLSLSLVGIGSITYWAFGYAFAFGDPGNAFIGYRYFFFESMPAINYQHWFFHLVFTATAATIVSGSMAERTEFVAYLVYTVGLSGTYTY